MNKTKTKAIVWFRHDLRLADNPALCAALINADEIIPLFILPPPAHEMPLGGASLWWLHHSLASLAKDLHARGATLVLRRGDAAKIVPALAHEIGALQVHAARSFEPAMRATDKAVDAALKSTGIAFTRHLSASLFAPERIKTKTGGNYGVYTPFAKACFEAGIAEDDSQAPAKIPGVTKVESESLESWKLLPSKPDWAGGLRETWQPGEAGARLRLQGLVAEVIANYHETRNLPGIKGTSKLSPHLHFGEISPRFVWQQASRAKGKGVAVYLKELLWREFSIYLLWHHPKLATQPIRPQFEKFPWRRDDKSLHAWQRGLTGYPIVDAGMRELWQTGWMHNRVRMITASFLIKHLLLPWQQGEAWFWDTLVDADLAANAASWQWVAGCGADAAPYFRIFNPVLQGRKFDPEGDYVRRYVPELRLLPDKLIHSPWEAQPFELAQAHVTLGQDYPQPIIELNQGRARALAAYKEISGNA